MRKLYVLFAFALSGCNIEIDGFSNDKFQQDFRFTYPLNSGATLTLENSNGSVDVAGWDRAEVEITGVKYGATEALRDEVKIDIQHSDSSVAIRTVMPSDPRQCGARYVIRVPRKITLSRITSTNGRVHTNDIDGNVHLKSSNGSLQVSKVKGDAEAQTSNGSVEATNIDGVAHLHTTNGHVNAEGVAGTIDASSSNGSITISLNDKLLHDVTAKTSNSSITLRVPPQASARVRAHTSNGSIKSDFDSLRRDREDRHNMEGTINGGGSGSPLLDLTTSNGSIKLEKY